MNKTLRDQFAMAAPITFGDALIECGYNHVGLTDECRAIVMGVLALMQYEYADAMMHQRNVE